MKYADISLGNLLSAPTPVASDIIEPKLGALPLQLLSWEDFERLCARLIQHQYEGGGLQVFKYGRSGQDQKGIDIIWQAPREKKYDVAQVKRWRKIKAGDIREWVKTFLESELASETSTWILCLSIDIQEDTNLIKAWHSALMELKAHGVEAEIWHKGWIEKLLRKTPELVETFFSKQISDRFCHTLSMPNEELQSYRKGFSQQYDSHLTIENESVRIQVLLPNRRSHRVSAILSFSRVNLAGVSLAIDGKDLVHWLQWAGHCHDPVKGPYTLPLGDPGRFLLTTQKFQLSLDSKEFDDLDWCLGEAWTHYLDAIQGLEANWRCLRFGRLRDSSQHVHRLCSVTPSLWRLIMDYAREHDYAKGESEEHIFDASGNGVLKVFSPRATAFMDAGYHLILYVYHEGGICGSHEPSMIIGWAPHHLRELSSSWGPRGMWDAEHAHNWLSAKLMPRVMRWYHGKCRKELSWISDPVKKFTGNFPIFDPGEHLVSYARLCVQQITEIDTLEALNNCLHSMQSHFSIYGAPTNIETSLVQTVLRCVQHLAYRLPEQHHDYIRGNLQLGPQSLVEGLATLLAGLTERWSNSTLLEMALRSLICCCETIANVSDDLKWLTQMQEPVWARMREDLLCEMFS